MREKNKIMFKREYEKHKEEQDLIGTDMDFLNKIEPKFDPLEQYFVSKAKRQKTE